MSPDFEPSRASVNVVVESAVRPEDVAELVRKIGGRFGCPECGLLGVDVHLIAQDPEWVTDVPSVRSTVIS